MLLEELEEVPAPNKLLLAWLLEHMAHINQRVCLCVCVCDLVREGHCVRLMQEREKEIGFVCEYTLKICMQQTLS